MRILVDEDVPRMCVPPLRHLLRGHVVEHIEDLKWKGKKDPALFADAARHGVDALLTNDRKQLLDPLYVKLIKRAGFHHVRYAQEDGVLGLGLAMGALIAAMPLVIAALERETEQHLVRISAISRSGRYELQNPRQHPPPYWPRK